MSHPQIVIHVRDGTVAGVYVGDDDAQVIVVDFDETGSASVQPASPRPLRDLAGSNIEAAIDAAFEQDILAEPAWEGAALPC